MGNSATAYSIFIKVQDLRASKNEESKKEGTNFSSFHELISEMAHMFLVSLCASLRSENDCFIRLWLTDYVLN